MNSYIIWISLLLKLMLKWEILLIIQIIIHYWIHKFLKRNYDIQITYFWHKFTLPNSFWWFWMISEILGYNIYKDIKHCNHVLDVWWFLGESAIYFMKHNKKVTVYEADPLNFKYLSQNIKSFNNIIWFNKAISSWNEKQLTFYKWINNDVACSSVIHQWKLSFTVDAISLKEAMTWKWFDAIKLDIEWWEYELIKNNKSFWRWLKVWQIEFHHFNHEDKLNTLTSLVKNLMVNWYSVIFLDEYGNVIKYEKIKLYGCKVFTLLFKI